LNVVPGRPYGWALERHVLTSSLRSITLINTHFLSIITIIRGFCCVYSRIRVINPRRIGLTVHVSQILSLYFLVVLSQQTAIHSTLARQIFPSNSKKSCRHKSPLYLVYSACAIRKVCDPEAWHVGDMMRRTCKVSSQRACSKSKFAQPGVFPLNEQLLVARDISIFRGKSVGQTVDFSLLA
jgi:hypothetical protein